MAQDYNTTLNLPQTDFSMRGNLPQKEPEMISRWESGRMYYKMIEKNKDMPKYVLHDGPPYANGDIHMGTALNKVLKDIIVKQIQQSFFSIFLGTLNSVFGTIVFIKTLFVPSFFIKK
ncbi:MAG: class I tRNA ligase family protein [Oscillospiraceae bacterium]|nr:class I tRNA ligase family protein [Oscillospiraceae bacterium]